jgi:hypothetical protein
MFLRAVIAAVADFNSGNGSCEIGVLLIWVCLRFSASYLIGQGHQMFRGAASIAAVIGLPHAASAPGGPQRVLHPAIARPSLRVDGGSSDRSI